MIACSAQVQNAGERKMVQDPPPLPYNSLVKLKDKAKPILDSQRNHSTSHIEFKHFKPDDPSQSEKKKPKPTKHACPACKKKKVRCHDPKESCKRQVCSCETHSSRPISSNDEANTLNDAPDTPTPSKTQLTESIPSIFVCRKPGLLCTGEYAGETSFCASARDQPLVVIERNTFPALESIFPITSPPFISPIDQHRLIDVYYENLNLFFPILNKNEMLFQLGKCMSNQKTYLSPFFFYALFARAAHVDTIGDNQTYQDLGTACMKYASFLASIYRDDMSVSTILALIIMANHSEQTKLREDFTRSWSWSGEALRKSLHLGLHRSCTSDKNTPMGQLCIRAFWLAYIADCTISMTYGRPPYIEERVIDTAAPKALDSDDELTIQWLKGLNSLTMLSKFSARVIKGNYSPIPFLARGPVKNRNAYLASADSWLFEFLRNDTVDNTKTKSTVETRIEFQEQTFMLTNLILLHRPYVRDSFATKNSTRPSYDVCSYAAIIITDTASKLEENELIYHSKSPVTVYSLVMALRIHIMNASSIQLADKYNAKRNVKTSMDTLYRLPQYSNKSSMLHDTLNELTYLYENRFEFSQKTGDLLSTIELDSGYPNGTFPSQTSKTLLGPSEAPSSANTHPPQETIFKSSQYNDNSRAKKRKNGHMTFVTMQHKGKGKQKEKGKERERQHVFQQEFQQEHLSNSNEKKQKQQLTMQQEEQQNTTPPHPTDLPASETFSSSQNPQVPFFNSGLFFTDQDFVSGHSMSNIPNYTTAQHSLYDNNPLYASNDITTSSFYPDFFSPTTTPPEDHSASALLFDNARMFNLPVDQNDATFKCKFTAKEGGNIQAEYSTSNATFDEPELQTTTMSSSFELVNPFVPLFE